MKKGKEQETKTSKSTPKIPSDKSKNGWLYRSSRCTNKRTSIPWSSTLPEQLNRGVSFAEGDESLNQQNISIAGIRRLSRRTINLQI